MKAHFVFFVLLLSLAFSKAIGQTLQLDSVQIFALPFNMSTTLSLTSYDIINSYPEYLKKRTLSTESDLKDYPFNSVSSLDSIAYCSDELCIDARIVIREWYRNSKSRQILIDRAFNYHIAGSLFRTSPFIKSWVSKYLWLAYK